MTRKHGPRITPKVKYEIYMYINGYFVYLGSELMADAVCTSEVKNKGL